MIDNILYGSPGSNASYSSLGLVDILILVEAFAKLAIIMNFRIK